MPTSIAPLNAFCDDTTIDGGSADVSVAGQEACVSVDGGNPASTPDKAFGGGTP
jgi:hypothetical protein